MKPMLAGKFREDKIATQLPVFVQTKFDGIRGFVRNGIAYTRSLKPVRSEQVQSYVAHHKHDMEGLDFEMVCGDPTAPNCYHRTDSSIMSYNKPDDELTFHVFDKWDEVLPFRERLAICEEIVNGFTFETHNRLVMAETQLIDSLDDLWTFYETQTLLGHEGIIIRGPDTYYKFGRGAPTVGELIKMKEGGWIDTEVRIINFHEERENTNEATINELGYTERSGHQDNLIGKGTLGAFEVEGKFEDGRPFTCRVGTGLDHATRQAVWNDKEGYRSKLVKMSYFNVGIKDKPRFPKFLGFRDPDDMDPEQMDLFS